MARNGELMWDRFSASELKDIAHWSQIFAWVFGVSVIFCGIISYIARNEASARNEAASGPRRITEPQAAKMRGLIGTNLNDAPIFVESIGDQEADAFAASLAVLLKSLGAKVIEQHNLREPKPKGVLFRYSAGNRAGPLLMDALINNGVEGVEKGDQVITDSNVYIRVGVKPL